MKKLLILTLTLITFIPVIGNTYYVSNSGNDANTGQSELEAFKTINKTINTISTGDTILLKRGDTFRESGDFITKGLSNIEINAYGNTNSPLPIICGSEEIKGWVLYKDGIYKAPYTKTIKELFANNNRMTLARYPNQGWLKIDNGESYTNSTKLSVSALFDLPEDDDDYWKDADVHWHRWSWWHEIRKVIDYTIGGDLLLEYKTSNMDDRPANGWGIYLTGKLHALDTLTEWYQDPGTFEIYLKTPDGTHPDNFLIEASNTEAGLTLNHSRVKNICFQQLYDGVHINQACTIENCEFINIYNRGIHALADAHDCNISYNRFDKVNNIAINWYAKNNGDNAIIEHNIITETALIPANQNRLYGYNQDNIDPMGSWWPWNNHDCAIVIWYGENISIRYNRIINTGYNAINIHAHHNFIEYNFIDGALLTLNDGAGIYANCSYTSLKNNIVSNVYGQTNSGTIGHVFSHGIWTEYLFDFTDNKVINNTCFNNGNSGLFFTNNFNGLVRNNVFYNNHESQMEISGREVNDHIGRWDNPAQNHIIDSNVFFGNEKTQLAYLFQNGFDYGSMRENYYLNPFRIFPIENQAQKKFTAEQFWIYAPWDDGSGKSDVQKLPAYRSFNHKKNLIQNGDFSVETLNWKQGKLSDDFSLTIKTGSSKLDNNCLQLETSGGVVLAQTSNEFILEKNRFYEINLSYIFDAFGDVQSDIENEMLVYIWDNDNLEIITEVYFPVDIQRNELWHIFQSNFTTGKATLNISFTTAGNKTLWVDNVRLQEVYAQHRLPENATKLICNDSLSTRSINIGTGNWLDIDGNSVNNPVTLAPFTSMILIKDPYGKDSELPVIEIDTSEHYIPNAIAIEQIAQPKMYPVPAKDFLMVTNIANYNAANIISVTGQVLATYRLHNRTECFNISNLPDGLYILHLFSNNGETYCTKFLKE